MTRARGGPWQQGMPSAALAVSAVAIRIPSVAGGSAPGDLGGPCPPGWSTPCLAPRAQGTPAGAGGASTKRLAPWPRRSGSSRARPGCGGPARRDGAWEPPAGGAHATQRVPTCGGRVGTLSVGLCRAFPGLRGRPRPRPYGLCRVGQRCACPSRANAAPSPPTPLPPADWQEAQVVTRRQRGRGVEGPTTLIVGSAAAGPDRCAASTVRQMRKTRGVARHPWTGRPGHGQRARPVLRVATDLPWCEKPRGVRGASSHLGLPPDRWRHRVPAPHPTRGADAPQRGQAVTLALAAGLTAHGGTMEEVLSERGPPDLRDRLAQPPTEDTASPFPTRYRGTPPNFARFVGGQRGQNTAHPPPGSLCSPRRERQRPTRARSCS